MNRVLRVALFGIGVSFSASGCGSDLPDVDCNAQPVPTFGEVTALQKCTECHSSMRSGAARREAPGSVNFDTYEAAKGKAEEGAEEVYGGDMPPEGSGVSLTAEEKQQFYVWALCGTPQ